MDQYTSAVVLLVLERKKKNSQCQRISIHSRRNIARHYSRKALVAPQVKRTFSRSSETKSSKNAPPMGLRRDRS